jgi:hypothetical protein
MWSIGGAALAAVLLSAGAVTLAMRRAGREMEDALDSFAALRHDLQGAVEHAGRDSGRARASRQVLLRHGGPATPR